MTTISDVLSGRVRKKPPNWPWTASFVLCCTAWAFDHDIIDTDPGRDALPGWARRRWLAENATPRGGVQLPASVRRFLASHGPFGKSLIAEVEAGVSDSILLAAILLGTDPAHTNEASALLLWDKTSEHPVISSLVTTSLDALDPRTAARYARLLAHAARSPDEAAAFNQAADRVSDDPAQLDPHRTPPRPSAPGHRTHPTGPP